MGLPLYVPPVESDVRSKNTTPSTQNNNRIRRTRRRSSDALREIRRRAILTEAMSQAVTTAHSDLSREQWQNRHLSRLRLERQARALESDPSHQIALNNARRESTRDPAHREPEEFMGIMQRHHDRARLLLNQELSSTTNSVTEESIQRFLANIRDPDPNMFSGATRGSNPASASSVPGPTNPRNTSVPGLPQNDGRTQFPGQGRPRGPSTHEIAPTPSYGQSIASTDQPTANEHYTNTFVGALNQELAQAGRTHHRWATEGPFPIDEPEQPPRSTMDHFMGFDEPEPPRAPRRRITSSLRRVAAPPSNPTRRPTVGWSDNANPPAPSGQSSSSATSRIFGDVNQIRNGPEAASARQYGWAVRYIDGNNVNNPLPSIHDLLSSNQVDGLGDRRRSLSPEGDGVWDTLLTTLTPDPQPPSLNSSFASTSEALAAAAAQEQPSSSQPTVVPTPNLSTPPAVPSPTARRGDEGEGSRSSVPLPVATTRAQMAAINAASRDTGSASPAGGSSGPTSATASQRIRSPFTAASAGTETGDESAVLGGVGLDEEDGCDDIDMDRRHEDFELDEDEEDEEEQAEFLGLSSQPSLARIGYLQANVTRQRLMQEQMQLQHGLARQILRERGANNGPQHPQPGVSGPHQTEEALDSLGIGGMQHIVRSLARREDIPDEWWAEAGLSRTLPREESS
ncbi:hypothetical protein F503_08179 [Ophiostoma piceae UAMH 11346]|uniref:Uncharacterized protein n=1 Tax=Ophiostoma piceae (strain UAMH 11346) TaxID=1262450 RepID=S3CH52_OPHP1|nr:hypothetical protein F503_08179 [Ophiostoma piceae UAMH 11346]